MNYVVMYDDWQRLYGGRREMVLGDIDVDRARRERIRAAMKGDFDPAILRWQQRFWRCEHHPSAIDNWQIHEHCEHGCDMTELRWYDNGTCKPPTS